MNSLVDRTALHFSAAEITPEENARRVMAEATRLTNLAPGEFLLWIDRSAERLGVPRANLEKLVREILKVKERAQRKAQAEVRRQEQRVEKQRSAARREEERIREREAKQAGKEAARGVKEKRRALADITRLPSEQHEATLAELAKRLGEKAGALRDEFHEVAEANAGVPHQGWHVDPWPKPVATAVLLRNIGAKNAKHVVMRPEQLSAVTLWEAMTWVHNECATHSPFLTITSPAPDSGKTTAPGVLARLVPKPYLSAESTGPSIFRFVDREKPTLVADEADDLFARKSDVKHIYNASWTRGTKIARQVTINGVLTTAWFDPFCPKAIGLLGHNLPSTLRSRSIEIRMVPKRPDEKVEPFDHTNDPEFATLRRKLARWAADNAAVLTNAKPLIPATLNNRAAANWRLLLAIAELAGAKYVRQAREAAVRLSRSGRRPSDGVQLLAEFKEVFARSLKTITSEDFVAYLRSDPTSVWAEYSRGGPVTQRQVACLLDQFNIHPLVLHPTGRKDFARRGYKAIQFVDAFARHLPADPIIRSPSGKRR